jgi:hypothetical protein
MTSSIKKTVKIICLAVFFLFIVVYAFYRSHDLIFGVKIKNVNLNDLPMQSGAKINNGVQKITGNARNAINLTLNGREISIDQAGNFNETIALLTGYNIINIRAQDKFGYVDEKNYQIMY